MIGSHRPYILKQRLAFAILILCVIAAAHITYAKVHPEWLLFREGDNLFQEGQWEKAIPLLEKSLALGATQPKISAQIAHAYAEIKNYPKAIFWYEAFLKDNPNELWARKALAGMYTANGDFEKASQEYNRILEQEQNHAK